jgi:hypothetical protein
MARFRDRFFTPQVARAITSPSGILLAGAGTAAAIAAGAFIPVAAGIGAILYGLRVAAAVPKDRDKLDDIQPRTLREPWRRFVVEALGAQERYQRAVATMARGPLRTRLEEIGRRIGDGVRECWRIAQRGEAIEDGMRQLEHPEQVRRQLAQVESEYAASGNDPRLSATAQALRAQLESTLRVEGTARETVDRLRLLDARLDEMVARAVELGFRASDPTDLGGLHDDVDSLVTEMEALRQALEETSGGRPAEGATR